MSKGAKTVAFKVPTSKLATGADAWVANRDAQPAGDREGEGVRHLNPVDTVSEKPAVPKERLARLTIDVPESLHRRVKMQCAARGQKMADVLREFLDREFPAS